MSSSQKEPMIVRWKDNIVEIGAGRPVVIQSMTNTDTADVESSTKQVLELAQAGSELVRLTVNTPAAAKAIAEIRRRLDEAEKYRYKKIVIGLVCTLDMLCIILFIQGYHNLIISMCVGIQMTAGVQLPIIIKSMTHNDQKRALNVVWCKKN